MCFKETGIYLPKKADNFEFMTKWSVIACDQYTSDISYWNKVKEFTKDNISALNLVFPEIYLEIENEAEQKNRIKNISENMIKYEKDLVCHENSVFYIERTLKRGVLRSGLLGAVDLEEYDYKKDSKTKIRSTEETVIQRIPARIKIRENALFEVPHVMILYEDKKNILLSDILKNKDKFKILYDFELMYGGGKIKAYKLDSDNIDFMKKTLGALEKNGVLFAVGDGNHSLAAAKEFWENIKKTEPPETIRNHPARYALAEIVNIYDESLEFEPIYRVLYETDPIKIISEMKKYHDISENNPSGKIYQEFEVYYGNNIKKLFLNDPEYSLFVKNLQLFLDGYLNENCGKIDYIHGKSETIELAKKPNSIGFIFETMKKSDLFTAITKDGVLPRKTFSMGEACDKRFYTECRKIK